MASAFPLRRSTAAIAAALAVFVTAEGSAASRAPAPAAPPSHTAAPAPAVPSAGTPGAASPTAVPASDRDFFTMAASSGMLEVEASRLALERSRDSQVRNFAQQMVEDHGKANAELKLAAKKAGMTDVPSSMTSTHNGQLERLRALSGPAFDREYVARVGMAAHSEAIALFEKASQDVENPELRSFAGATLPKLREHLRKSQSIAQAVAAGEDRMKGATAPRAPSASSATGTGTTGSDTSGTGGSTGAGSTATGNTGTATPTPSPGK